MRNFSAQPVWAVVPVKKLTRAKSRLGNVLSPAARRRLVLTMLEDVLATLRGAPTIGPIVVVTADRWVALVGEREGARILREGPTLGLNSALRLGARQTRKEGAKRLLFIPADVPFATAAEVGAVVEASLSCERDGAVIVPAKKGGGTNALMLSPPKALSPSFGEDSFAAHCRQAVERCLELKVVQLPGLGMDIDEPTHLTALIEDKRTAARYAFLNEALREHAMRRQEPAQIMPQMVPQTLRVRER
ncbi:MAG: 2-phospho-L-lactate guanylyltransferase [Hyphomicrobiales bacterium]|nr:2-phospho-L-lactate guanylyltransferase [Hyphomicrobiales bacterium]